MRAIGGALLCALLLGLVVPAASAFAAPDAHRTLSATAFDSEPVGIWPVLAQGKGTDSRKGSEVANASGVHWRFALRGAPKGTEFTVWAQFRGAGELQASRIGEAVVVTRGHDVLLDASAHCIVPAEDIEGVSLQLIGVNVTGPAEHTDQAGSEQSSDGQGAGNESYLPYTGAPGWLPMLATVLAALGLLLRRVAST